MKRRSTIAPSARSGARLRGPALTVALAALLGASPAQAETPRRPQIVYVNFSDGTETLTAATADDALRNLSAVGGAAPFPAFVWPSVLAGEATRAQVVRRVARKVHELFLPYNVLVTTARPAEGPYTMVMVGGVPASIGWTQTVAGLAFLDCGNKQENNVAFAFAQLVRGREDELAITIAQEAAHAFGLEHSQNPEDVMYPRLDPRQRAFLDVESSVADAPIAGQTACGALTQNPHRRLLDVVGAWAGDDKPFPDDERADRTPPTVGFLEPAGGAAVAQPFTVRARAEDPGGIDHVVLSAGDEKRSLRGAPFAWSLAGFPPGALRLTLTAYDASGNTATSTLDVTVAESPGGGCAFVRTPTRRSGILWGLAAAGLLALATCSRGQRRL